MAGTKVDEFLKKHGLKEGDIASVDTAAGGALAGTVIPQHEPNLLVLKLESGYNAGIALENIKSVKKISEGKKTGKPAVKKIEKRKGLPSISILHTGGTIASRVDYRTGAVFAAFNPEDLLALFPELADVANFSSRLIAKMWSDDLRFAHFGLIAKAVEEEHKKGAHGIIIGMGTDNLAVASAALAFVLEECPVPVLLVGAQRSSDRGSSDAGMNLVCAAEFIKKTDFAGVAICMHEGTADEWCAILPATKTRKLHTSRRDAFRPVNDTAIARVNYKTHEVQFIKKDYPRRKQGAKIVVRPKMEEKVGFLKIHINMFPEEFEFFKKHGYKGLVIEGTGLGHTPGHVPNEICKIHAKFFPALKELIGSGCVVVMASQCIFGRVKMHVYDKAMDLVDLGVIPGEDMLAETAFVKLAWLLGNYRREDVAKLIAQNLRGEITSRTAAEERGFSLD